jgi:hypothetical protein
MSKFVIATVSFLVTFHILMVGMAGAVACDETHERAAMSIHASGVCAHHHTQPLGGTHDEGGSPCFVHMCTCGQVSEPARRFVADFVPAAGSSLSTFDSEVCLEIHGSAIDHPPRNVA